MRDCSIMIPPKSLLLLQISYWGVNQLVCCALLQIRGITPTCCTKNTCAHLKLTGKCEQPKPGTGNITKVMLKALGFRVGKTIKIIPKIKRLPRRIILKHVTVLTLKKQGQSLVSNNYSTKFRDKKDSRS